MPKDIFKDIAIKARAVADLCDKQKDTVAWWADYGVAFQELTTLIMEAKPSPKHEAAAHRAMAAARAPE